MHVVIVGCGRVGAGLALRLDAGGSTVSIIDRAPNAFRRLGGNFGGVAIAGIGFDRDTLIDAGIERADALAAVTNGDNSNIVVARVARETFDVERVVARIYDSRRAEIYQRLGIPTIAPARWATDQILRRMLPAQPTIEWTDPSADVALIERTIASGLAGIAVSEVDFDGAGSVVAITRLGHTRLVEPDAVLQEGDLVYIVARSDRLEELDTMLRNSGGGH